MGATGVYMSMKETKKMILKDYNFSNDKRIVKTISHANGKGGMWIFLEVDDKIQGKYFTIEFAKMSHKSGETIYRQYNFEEHPYFYDVPENWLNKVSANSKTGKDWIEKVRKIYSFDLQPGLKFKKSGTEEIWETVYNYSPKFYVVKDPSGKVWKMDKDLLTDYFLRNELK